MIKLSEIDPFTCWNAVTPACLIAAEASFATVFVGNKKVLEAVDADPTAFAKFTTFQGQYPHDTTVAVVVNGNLMRL